jgi:hypothetical protein
MKRPYIWDNGNQKQSDMQMFFRGFAGSQLWKIVFGIGLTMKPQLANEPYWKSFSLCQLDQATLMTGTRKPWQAMAVRMEVRLRTGFWNGDSVIDTSLYTNHPI